MAWFDKNISAADMEKENESKEENQLYVLKSYCDDLFVFFVDSMHYGNDLDGSEMAYDLDEAKEFGMRLKNCKGFTFDTWRPERKDKQGIAWFHSEIIEFDTKRLANPLTIESRQSMSVY